MLYGYDETAKVCVRSVTGAHSRKQSTAHEPKRKGQVMPKEKRTGGTPKTWYAPPLRKRMMFDGEPKGAIRLYMSGRIMNESAYFFALL